jgi:hypothetical protein
VSVVTATLGRSLRVEAMSALVQHHTKGAVIPVNIATIAACRIGLHMTAIHLMDSHPAEIEETTLLALLRQDRALGAMILSSPIETRETLSPRLIHLDRQSILVMVGSIKTTRSPRGIKPRIPTMVG